MDPLSGTLAAITLATAVKDLVELGQKIHESFAKVSKNLRNAKHVAENITEMVEEIKVFCQEHKNTLHDMKEFCQALQGLLRKFRNFEASILPLLPKPGRSKLGSLIRGWWNNNKIKEHIANLQADIVTVMRRYMMASTMRIELKQGESHQETIRGLTGIAQGLEVVQRDIGVLHTTSAAARTHYSYKSTRTTRDEFTSNIIMFAESTPSTSMPMLRSPDAITEEVATAVYVKVQINSIATIIERMSTMPVTLTQASVNNFHWNPVSKQQSMGIMHLRHHVVRKITKIRDLLESEHLQTVYVDDATTTLLNNLSTDLGILGMRFESTLVGSWTVTLSRTLVTAFGDAEPELAARLAFYLANQSNRYYNSGDGAQSIQAIQEAYSIIQNLRNQHGEEDRFQILYGDVLLEYAKSTDIDVSIETSMEALQILEGILNIQTFTQLTSDDRIERVARPSSSFLHQLFSSAQEVLPITIYANALQDLGGYLSTDAADSETAVDLAYLALAVRRKLVSLHGDKYIQPLAQALSSLVQGQTASYIPRDRLLELADECVRLFRKLAEKNPASYARRLASVLYVKAKVLSELNRNTEAIAAWEEMFGLASQIVQDSRMCASALDNLSNLFRHLKRHDDAVRTGTLAITRYQDEADAEAIQYSSLSLDYQHLRHYKEAVQAARKSVTLFQGLAMRDPNEWMGDLTWSLCILAHSLAAFGAYSEALLACKESLGLLENFLATQRGSNWQAIVKYCAAGVSYHKMNLIFKEKDESLEICSTSIQYLQQLSAIYPQHADKMAHFLFAAEFYYAYNMCHAGRSQDSQQYIDSWLDQWSRKVEASPESTAAIWFARMINLKVDILDAEGRTKQALLMMQNVENVVKASVSTSQMIESMHRTAQIQGRLGDSGEALAIAERALQLARDITLEPIVNGLIWSLHAVSSTALLLRDYNRAVEAAQEGCKLLNTPEGLKFDKDKEFDSFIRPSMYALLSSAEANLGRYSTAVEYAHRAVELSLEIGENKLHISPTTAQHSHIETRGNLAEILVITGNLDQARQICEERQAYFTDRVEKRRGEYRELAPILRMLGILCCGEGRHDEGAAAAKELARIIKALGSAFPSLQEEVKIRLRRQVQVPILKVLNEMSDNLGCGHQSEISSLFAL